MVANIQHKDLEAVSATLHWLALGEQYGSPCNAISQICTVSCVTNAFHGNSLDTLCTECTVQATNHMAKQYMGAVADRYMLSET